MGTSASAQRIRAKIRSTILKASSEGLEVSRKRLIGQVVVEGHSKRSAREVIDGFIDSGTWITRKEGNEIMLSVVVEKNEPVSVDSLYS